jgi:hypothetical protein
VVSHYGAINTGVADILGLDRDVFFPAANTGISLVRIQAERRLVVTLNDQSHLCGVQAPAADEPEEGSTMQPITYQPDARGYVDDLRARRPGAEAEAIIATAEALAAKADFIVTVARLQAAEANYNQAQGLT